MKHPDRDLVDLIYEAAFVPETWQQVFDALSRISDAIGCVLAAVGPSGMRWIANSAITPMMNEFVAGGWAAKNTRLERLVASGYSGFVTDRFFFTDEEMARDEAYTGFYWPRGLGESTGTLILVPNGDMLFFNLERWRQRGPVERPVVEALDRLRPHLTRSALLAARRQFDRARTAVETLDSLSLPAAALTLSGKTLAANRLLELATPQVRIGAGDRIALDNQRADALLREALTRLATGDEDAVASIPLPAADTTASAVLHVLPIRRDARDIFSGTLALIALTPLTRTPAPGIELLTGLFDLTPAEARVARGLTEGLTLQDIAARQQLSGETIRTQLKAVLAKTGTERQAELVALLARSVLTR